MKFAKLFELENNEQVLLTYNHNKDEEIEHEVVIRTDFDGVIAQAKLGFKEKEKAINVIEEYDLKKAINFREKITDFII